MYHPRLGHSFYFFNRSKMPGKLHDIFWQYKFTTNALRKSNLNVFLFKNFEPFEQFFRETLNLRLTVPFDKTVPFIMHSVKNLVPIPIQKKCFEKHKSYNTFRTKTYFSARKIFWETTAIENTKFVFTSRRSARKLDLYCSGQQARSRHGRILSKSFSSNYLL